MSRTETLWIRAERAAMAKGGLSCPIGLRWYDQVMSRWRAWLWK